MGGSSKSQVVGYTYSLGAHFIFSAGEVDFVSAITFRDHETYAWQGNESSNTTLTINKPSLFGGQASQGGVVGKISLMFGAPAQMPNTYLVGLRGALVPAYRNVLGVTWEGLNIGGNPYVPTWGVEYSRIHKRWSLDGINSREQWYDAKAAIPFDNNHTIDELFTAQHWDYKWFPDNATPTEDQVKGIGIDLTNWSVNQEKSAVPFTSGGTSLPYESEGISYRFPIRGSYFDASVGTVMWYRWNFTPKKSQDITLAYSTLFQMDLWLNGNKLDDLTIGSETIIIPASKLIVGSNNVLAIRTSGGTPGSTAHYQYGRYPMYINQPGYFVAPMKGQIASEIATLNSVLGGTYSFYAFKNASNPNGKLNAGLIITEPYIGATYFKGTDQRDSSWSYVLVPATPAQPNTVTFNANIADLYDMNPIHWLRETYTEPWARRFDEALFPDADWQAAADTVYNEGLGITTFYDGSSSIEAHQAEVRRHIQCEVYKDRKDGKFKPKLIRNDYVVASLLLLNESNINDISDDGGQVFGQLTTSVTVSYTDTENGWIDGSVTVSDIALAQQQGKVIAVNLDYKMFTSQKVAARMAQTMLKTLSTPLKKYTIDAQRVAKDLNKGSVFKVSWAAWGVTEKVMRVTDVNYGNGLKNNIIITCTEDIFSISDGAYIAPPTTSWTPPFSEPTTLNNRLVIEAPYLELVQLQGQSAVDLQLTNVPESGYVLAAVGRSANATKAMMFDSISTTYNQIGVVDFCPTATLTSDCPIVLGGTLVQLVNISNELDTNLVVVGSWCQIDNEIWRVDSIVSGVMTIGRGCLDTLPAIHLAGAKIYFWDNAALVDDTTFISGDNVNVKLSSVNPKGQQTLSDTPTDIVGMVGRAVRPYNMANVKINGGYYTTSISGDLILTWANRNRLAQTSATIYDFTGGNITPESGVTYDINLLDATDNSIALALTGITGTSTTITAATLAALTPYLIIQITAVRDGINSYQSYAMPLDNSNSSRRVLTTGEYRVTTTSDFRTVA